MLFVSMALLCARSGSGADPTSGFAEVHLTKDMFKLHKPYDKQAQERYKLVDGVRWMWVYGTDKPLSPTRPLSELLIEVRHVAVPRAAATCRLAVNVFVDGTKQLTVGGHGGASHYFKFGVYTMTNHSDYMESRWKDVRVYTKH